MAVLETFYMRPNHEFVYFELYERFLSKIFLEHLLRFTPIFIERRLEDQTFILLRSKGCFHYHFFRENQYSDTIYHTSIRPPRTKQLEIGELTGVTGGLI